MRHGGKLSCQLLTATGDTGQDSSGCPIDTSTQTQFLIDMGAEVSIITPSPAEQRRRDNITLQAANNISIMTCGKHYLTLDLRLKCTFR